jgi:hypothetical protein
MNTDVDGVKRGHRILWIEDDYLDALANHLIQKGYRLSRAFQVYRAEEILDGEGTAIDLILLDLMMDLEDPDLQRGYNPENTLGAYRTGLQFYRRNQDRLAKLGIPVLVYTILGNQVAVKKEFLDLGLPVENFLDKNRFANVNLVEAEIERVLRGRSPKAPADRDRSTEIGS